MKRERVWSVLLALCMLLSLAPALGGSARAAYAKNVLIAGEEAYFDANTKTFTGGSSCLDTTYSIHQRLGGSDDVLYAIFTENSSGGAPILTLRNYKSALQAGISDNNSKKAYGIYADGDLTIKLRGNNELHSALSNDAIYGIYVDGDLTITNEKNQTATLDVNMSGTAANTAAGICCTGKLTIENTEGGSVTVTVNGSPVTNGKSCGVYAVGGVEMSGGTLNACGGSVSGGASGGNGSYGIRFTDGSQSTSRLSLTTGGTVVAKGYTCAAYPTGRLAAPKLLCDTNYSGSNKKVSAADGMDTKYAELRTDGVGLAVTGWEYGAYGESANGPVYCKGCTGIAITYAGRGGTTYAGSATRPTNVGDYTVTATYNGKSASANFTISPRDLSRASVNFGTQKTYNGSAQSVVVSSVTCDGKTLVSGTDYTVASGDTATNVGNTGLTLTGKGNYAGSRCDNWSLQKATPTAADFDVPAIAAQTYTGSAIAALPAPTLKSGKTGCGAVTVKYNGSTTRPVNAGSYTVTFDVAEGQNFKSAAGLAYGTLTVVAAPAVIASGTVGTLSWRLTEDGVLTISGTGAIPDYSKTGGAAPDIDARPWNAKWSKVTSLVVESGVTHIGDRAFQGYTYLTSATLADSVTSIGESAFNTCTGLTDVTMGDKVALGNNSFRDTPAEPYILARENDAYTASRYFSALCGVALTGNYRDDVIAIARSQTGYHEGDSTADYAGGSAAGTGDYTEYGRYLTSVGNAWCSEFATWCVRMAGVPTSLLANSRGANAKVFTSDNTSGRYYSWAQTSWAGGGYTPQKGDLILWYFKTDGNFNAATYYNKDLSHTSILESVTDNKNGTVTLHVVHGNSDNRVRESDYTVNAATGEYPGYGCVGYIVAPNYSGSAETHTVTFNANGGTVSATRKTVANGGLYGALPLPVREGYGFLGWYTAAEGGRRVNMYTPVSLETNQTLYARWDDLTQTRITDASVSGTTLTCSVRNAPANAVLIAAWYDASGRMLGMTSANVGEGNTMNATLTLGANAASCKLMLADKTTYAPLCPAWKS